MALRNWKFPKSVVVLVCRTYRALFLLRSLGTSSSGAVFCCLGQRVIRRQRRQNGPSELEVPEERCGAGMPHLQGFVPPPLPRNFQFRGCILLPWATGYTPPKATKWPFGTGSSRRALWCWYAAPTGLCSSSAP